MGKQKKKQKKTEKSQTSSVFLAVLFVLVFLGTVYILFPVSNPLNIVRGAPGSGIFYASLWAIGMATLLLLVYAMRQTMKDLLESFGYELGIDIEDVREDYKKIIKDEIMVLKGKKQRPSEHSIDMASEPKKKANQ